MLISPAYAQTGGVPGFDLISLMPLLLIFVVFYFLLIRPQKKMKQHREMISAIKRGDRVLTAGGIIGSVVKVEDAELLVEIAKDVRVRVARSTISDVLSKPQLAGETAKPAGATAAGVKSGLMSQLFGKKPRPAMLRFSSWGRPVWASACSAWSTACPTCFRGPDGAHAGLVAARADQPGSTCRAARICCWRSSWAR